MKRYGQADRQTETERGGGGVEGMRHIRVLLIRLRGVSQEAVKSQAAQTREAIEKFEFKQSRSSEIASRQKGRASERRSCLTAR